MRRQVIEDLKRRYIASGCEEADFLSFLPPEGEPGSWAEWHRAVQEALATLPFGSKRRVVVVGPWKQVGPKQMPWLADYVKHPNPKSCLVVFLERFEGDESEEIPSDWKREKEVELKWCRVPAPYAWVLERARAFGKKISPKAIQMILDRVGKDPHALALVVEQLALLGGKEEDEILPDHVQALFPASWHSVAFEIIDRAGAGELAHALEALHQGLHTRQIIADQFIGACGWYARMVWQRSANAPDGLPYRSRADFSSSPLRRKALLRLSRRSPEKIQNLLDEILKADVALKTGHPAPELLADRLLIRFSEDG